ncbi:RNA-binding domain-containing protein [Methanobacterium alcaliphilum]|uniref:RNA-binding domain-containing protein n=1 Tax=Methanobacterium alcaliphilum TaxID=392018 RepID=UPI00200A1646|nr:RNA-binding domain-containing protein [Methanobacterium alcaliphilum]MCK9150640.1 hypothetical protein [Methanobacterium alcaliphilum]
MECLVNISSKINATEDSEKVVKSVQNIFNGGSLKIDEKMVLLQGDCSLLKNFKEILENEKIRATARSVMESSLSDDKIEFILSKQTAYVGVVNFVSGTESPLGDIDVQITSKNTDQLLDWLAPVEDLDNE